MPASGSAALTATSLSVSRGRQVLLAEVDVVLAGGHRVGLVGPNGVGKSTLLAVLAGALEPDEGSVALAPPTATVGWLTQEHDRRDETVDAFLRRRTGVAAVQVELDSAVEAMAAGTRAADDRYSAALERWLALGAADIDARIGSTFAELGLSTSMLDAPTATLSGGELARTALAGLLISRFDIILLDEPTNDLDLDSLERLEGWLLTARAPVLLVSHDRSFLERVVTDVIEIDHHSHRAATYSGNWSSYLAERALSRQHAQERYDRYDTERRSLARRAQREREWATQGLAKVRRSDERDKFIRHFKVNQTEQLAGRAARTARAIDRLEVVEEPRDRWELRLDIPTTGRSGDRVLWAQEAVVERGGRDVGFRLGPVTLDIAMGDRIAITGANGSGKSTLLELLLGRTTPTSGTAGIGSSVHIGEIEQARRQASSDRSLVRLVGDATAARGAPLSDADVRTLLAKFDLRVDHVTRPSSTLSPGERTRAVLALLMATGANLLVLDEPTNHLDLEAIEQLESAVDLFGGTVLLVTHDRTFLDRFRATRRLALDGGEIRELDVP